MVTKIFPLFIAATFMDPLELIIVVVAVVVVAVVVVVFIVVVVSPRPKSDASSFLMTQ